ncbi:MAG: mitochondrial fission ELM1 family protein [Alphaproteobacteria bacterium]|nr:mitochondrial fission ELM1 family protein [Alphaproteobacteria bacterium]MBF0250012.1 mitochondrial fission ELM1 family protein [Alphaproteobacteria bacterium]
MALQGDNARVWLLIDDRAGNRAQVLGVARALGLPFEIKTIEYTIAAELPNYMLMASFSMLTRNCRVNLAAPWPDVVIAAGRRTAPVARRIKELSGGKAFLTQIMHPGSSGEDDFQLIAVPRHDGMAPAPNRFEVTGAPHGVTPETLAEARLAWTGKFDHLPKPWVALIVGGDTKRKTFNPDMARELGERAAKLARDAGGSLLVTTSRRSTPEATGALIAALGDVPANVFTWGDAGDNPYMGYLALADYVIVTGDSVSMCSEACAAGKPVYIFAPKKLTAHKHGKLHQDLYAKGHARPLEAVASLEIWSHEPLNAAYEIAAEMRRRLGLSED